jgi:hypothetical protein
MGRTEPTPLAGVLLYGVCKLLAVFCAGEAVIRGGKLVVGLLPAVAGIAIDAVVLRDEIDSSGFRRLVQLATANKTKRGTFKRLGRFIAAHVKRERT